MRRLLSARWLWPALAVLAACVPFAGGFSLTNIFYIRDLTMFFWPRHLWIHRSLMAGSWPLWDPYAAAGQAAFSDALNQLFLPPVLLLRVLPPVPGFNLLVAAPFPLAALGMWFFLRRHVSETSAAFGAIVFAASGPVVSTGNFPNLSWSVAWIPWIVVGRRSRSRGALRARLRAPDGDDRVSDALRRAGDDGRDPRAARRLRGRVRRADRVVARAGSHGRASGRSDFGGGGDLGGAVGADGAGGQRVAARPDAGRQFLVGSSALARGVGATARVRRHLPSVQCRAPLDPPAQ